MLSVITITIGWWIIPAILSIVFLWLAFGKREGDGDLGNGPIPTFDFTILFRLLWLVPLCLTWAIYFAIIYFSSR